MSGCAIGPSAEAFCDAVDVVPLATAAADQGTADVQRETRALITDIDAYCAPYLKG